METKFRNLIKYYLNLAKKISQEDDLQRLCEAIGMLKVCQEVSYILGYMKLTNECYKWKNILLKKLGELRKVV